LPPWKAHARSETHCHFWVLAGGVVAAVAGLISSGTADLFLAFADLSRVTVIARGNCCSVSVNLPKPTARKSAANAAWSELLRQPRLIVAMVTAIISYA
jgi:hypothetical protein